MYNSFGDTAFVSKSASTFGYFAKDFDRTKTLEDFIGAFGVTATVDVDSQSSEKTFRMDIARINDRDVLISGMTDMRDFAPQLKGYYDKELHMLIVEPQYAGMYNQRLCDARLLERTVDLLGRRRNGRRLHRRHALLGFKPLLARRGQQLHVPALQHAAGVEFELPAPVRRFENLLVPQDEALQQASAQTVARAAKSRTGSIETGGQRFTTYLTGERVAVPAKASGSTAAKVPAEGKRLRTDLVLHTR